MTRKSKEFGGWSTFGDALSDGDKRKIAKLRADLAANVRASVAKQANLAKAAWQIPKAASAPVNSGSETGKRVENGQRVPRILPALFGESKLLPKFEAKANARPKIAEASKVPQSNKCLVEPRRPFPVSKAPLKRVELRTAGKIPDARPRSASKMSKVNEKVAPTKFAFWDFPDPLPVREHPPSVVSNSDRRNFEELISLGGSQESNFGGDPIFGTIGLDLGTSSTKVVVRFPYEAGQPAIAIPAPSFCLSDRNPYLWQTVIWFRESDGQFSAIPESNFRMLHSIKQSIIGGAASLADGNASQKAISRAAAAASYISLVIRYARGWLAKNQPALVADRNVVWSVNLGLPAAIADDGLLAKQFRQVSAAGLLLANSGLPNTSEIITEYLKCKEVISASTTAQNAAELGIAVVPEVAAEVHGFARAKEQPPGLYLMIDVGASTLDVCTININPGQFAHTNSTFFQKGYSIFFGDVRPLGVEAVHWFMSRGKSVGEVAEQIERCMTTVTWGTKKLPASSAAKCWKADQFLSVYLVGGGAGNELHKSVVSKLSEWSKLFVRNQGIRLLEMEKPKGLILPVELSDIGRLAVAWGLSYPSDEIGQIELPSEIDVPEFDLIKRTEREFVSKDQV
jgi:hypothetical protein